LPVVLFASRSFCKSISLPVVLFVSLCFCQSIFWSIDVLGQKVDVCKVDVLKVDGLELLQMGRPAKIYNEERFGFLKRN
jgi:hypothetical protein